MICISLLLLSLSWDVDVSAMRSCELAFRMKLSCARSDRVTPWSSLASFLTRKSWRRKLSTPLAQHVKITTKMYLWQYVAELLVGVEVSLNRCLMTIVSDNKCILWENWAVGHSRLPLFPMMNFCCRRGLDRRNFACHTGAVRKLRNSVIDTKSHRNVWIGMTPSPPCLLLFVTSFSSPKCEALFAHLFS